MYSGFPSDLFIIIVFMLEGCPYKIKIPLVFQQ